VKLSLHPSTDSPPEQQPFFFIPRRCHVKASYTPQHNAKAIQIRNSVVGFKYAHRCSLLEGIESFNNTVLDIEVNIGLLLM
jgi:hypothetical protein